MHSDSAIQAEWDNILLKFKLTSVSLIALGNTNAWVGARSELASRVSIPFLNDERGSLSARLDHRYPLLLFFGGIVQRIFQFLE